MVKLIMLGLDGCSPDQIYRHVDELPNSNKVMNAGTHGINRSVVPPITPHAWITIFSGKNPGTFGYWDFNYRTNYAYTEDASVTYMTCKEPRLHNILPQYGLKMGLAGILFSSATLS